MPQTLLIPLLLLIFSAPAFPLQTHAGSTQNEIDRLHHLSREIERHDHLYFQKASPEISDSEYDELKRELLILQEKYPLEIDIQKSPAIGDDRSGFFKTHRHGLPMLSLNKAFSENDLLAFHNRILKTTSHKNITYWIEPKYDGIAISLTYQNGRLIHAATRGNGIEGDDVTANVRKITNIPQTLTSSTHHPIPAKIEIRGEIFISFTRFNHLNYERKLADEPPFANPRNLAAGTLKLQDPDKVAERGLELVCFGWGEITPAEMKPESMSGFREKMTAWGLPTITDAWSANGFNDMFATVNKIGANRSRYPFPIDGAVIKLDRSDLQDRLGSGRNAPNWAIAMKFPPQRTATRIHNITLQIGRTGRITPVAELEPVEIDGSTISRASLHNAAEIDRLGLRIGDLIFVEKSGDIIPVITGIDKTRRPPGSSPYRFPQNCPACGSPLIHSQSEKSHHCPNRQCPARIEKNIEHFSTVLGIRGLGPATISALVRETGLKSPAGLYLLNQHQIASLPGFGTRSAENILKAIDATRQPEWDKLIFAIGIPGVGAHSAQLLASAFPDFPSLQNATAETLQQSPENGGPGFSEKTAASIAAHLTTPETIELLTQLENAGIHPQNRPEKTGALAGKTIAITGRFSRWNRTEIENLLTAAGARVTGTLSRKTDLLISGESPGSKLTRAKELQIEVIDEQELLHRLKSD